MAQATWHSRRRFFVALGIVSIMLVAGVSAAGFIQVDDTDVPATFGVPAPKPGDRAEYTYSLVDASGPEPIRVGQELPIFAFEVGAGTDLVDSAGRPVEATIRVESRSWSNIVDDYDTGASHWGQWIGVTQYGTADGRNAGFASTFDGGVFFGLSPDQSDPTGLGLVNETRSMDIALRGFNFKDEASAVDGFGVVLPCGAVHALQGVQVPTDRAITLTRGCFVWEVPVDPETPGHQLGEVDVHLTSSILSTLMGSFEPVGWQELTDGPALAFRATASKSGPAAHVWFDPEIPFAVQMAFPAGDGRFHVMRLSDLDRVAASAAPLSMSAPPAAMRQAMRSWGPDDVGVDMPFTASEAWQHAVQQDDVAQLLAAHPGRLLTALRSEVWGTASDRPDIRWYFDMQDARGVPFSFTVTWSNDSPEPLPAITTPVVQSPLAPTIRTSIRDSDTPGPVIPRHMVNHFAPTVASTLAALRAIDGTSATGRSWGAELTCVHSTGPAAGDCEAYGYRVTVTHIRETSDNSVDPAGPSAQIARSRDTTSLTVDGQGGLRSLENTAIEQDWVLAPTAADKSAPSPPPAAPPPGWIPDTRAVIAGAGLLGFLAAALYYFGPGFLGLFSRIKEDKVLEHPSRRLLHDAIHGQPGIHHQELVRALGKGRGGAEHHLRKLTAAGLITATVGPGYTCYFPHRTDRRVVAAGPAMRSETARSILATLREQPGSHGGHIAQHLGVNRATVSHHLQRMEEAGLIETRRDGRAIRAYPTHVADMVA